MSADDRRLPSLFLIPLTLAIVGLFLFMALLNGQRDLTVLSLILFGIAAGAKLWTRWSLAGIECSISIDKRRVFPGEKLFLKATAENRKILPVWLQVRAPVSGLAHGAPVETAVTAESGLLWYQKASFRWELTALRRGIHHIGPLGITSGDLFGFFPKEKEMAETIEVVVYPRLVPLKPLTAPRRDFFGIPGAESPVEDPVYILGTRDYQHGRPAKYIHWKATARHHKLQEKIFEPSAQEKMLLVVDVGQFARHGAEEAFERMLETVASAAVRLAERGCAVGLVTNGRMTGEGSSVVSVTRNPRQLTILIEALARVRMEPARGLIDTFRLHLRVPWGVSCLYFALEKDETARMAREYFTQRRIPFLFFAGHPFSDSAEARVAGSPAIQGPDDNRAGEGLD
ncbi:MAG: DUF58 domain-containing protein [Deltaproteobacteria bacterium]|nr:DUF58 domain-containing protein [Deltaproteobacteria bacterium]